MIKFLFLCIDKLLIVKNLVLTYRYELYIVLIIIIYIIIWELYVKTPIQMDSIFRHYAHREMQITYANRNLAVQPSIEALTSAWNGHQGQNAGPILRITYLLYMPGIMASGQAHLTAAELCNHSVWLILNHQPIAVQMLPEFGINNADQVINQLLASRTAHLEVVQEIGRGRVGPTIMSALWEAHMQRVNVPEWVIRPRTHTNPEVQRFLADYLRRNTGG